LARRLTRTPRPRRVGLQVVAVDHPASQADARERSAGLAPVTRRLELVAVDLRSDSLDGALGRASHDPAVATTWTAPQVGATLAALGTRSAPGSVLVVQYQARAWLNIVARRLPGLTARLARLENPLADQPWRSLWTEAQMGELLERHGFTVRRDGDLLAIVTRIGSPTKRRRSLSTGRVAIASYDRRADDQPASPPTCRTASRSSPVV
jgi:O-methyltransferase involved in polyketide biosynthesis